MSVMLYLQIALALSDVRFLLALTPDKCIRTFNSAQPKCMWSSGTQKMMWQLQSLPYQTEPTDGSGGVGVTQYVENYMQN